MNTYINQAPCLFFCSKDDGTISFVNDTLCKQLGFTSEELTGQKLDVIFTISTRIFQQTHFFPLLKMHGHAEEIYITLQTKEKAHLPVLINAERKIIDGEPIYLHAGIIVHNRKKFEEELIAAKKTAENALSENTALMQAKQSLQQHAEQLDEQINRVKKQNEELKQFNRVVTHDLQEPLRKLAVFSSLFLDESETLQKEKIVEKLTRASENMRSIISGLQQYVWLTEVAVNLTSIDLNEVVLTTIDGLKNEFPEIDIQLDVENLPLINGDNEQIKMLFYQLFANAIKFKKQNSPVHIKVNCSTLKLNVFKHVKDKYKYAEYYKLQVKDNGIGFDNEFKNHVFQLFKRLHDVSGRGVGLSLCKKIIENHHGEITIDSIKDEGTTITVFLPMIVNA